MVKNFIDAKEARKLVDETQKPLNILFRRIREEASYGISHILHSVEEYDDFIAENLIKTLKEAGFTVSEETNENNDTVCLKISW